MTLRFARILLDPAPAAPPVGAPAGGGAPAPEGGAPASSGSVDLGAGAHDSFDAAFADLEEPKGGPPAAAPAAAPPTAPPKTAAGTPPKPTAQPPAKPAQQPPPKPGAQTPPKEEVDEVDGIPVPRFKKDGEFRSWGLNGYKKAKQLETELAARDAKLRELEGRIPKNPKEAEELRTKIADAEKRMVEKEREIQFLNYERSQEYKDKYELPYQKAVNLAYSEVKELLVSEPDPQAQLDADGKRPTRERSATNADFEQVYQLPLGPASKLAKEKFGDSAPIVLSHRSKIKELARGATEALDSWKKNSEAREKQELETASTQAQQIEKDWQDINSRMSQDPRGKELWGEDLNDKELTAELQKGFQFADQRFSQDYEKMPVREKMILDAMIRHRVAGFYMQRALVKRYKTEVDALKKEVADLRDSGEPGRPRGSEPAGGGGPPPTDRSPMEMFDEKVPG